MTDLIDSIFRYEMEHELIDFESLPEFEAAFHDLDSYLSAVEKSLGLPFHNKLYSSMMALIHLEQTASVHYGYRLCGRLLSELLPEPV